MSICAAPALGQSAMGAREVAMGQATAALPGSKWSVFGNPAMGEPKERSVSFFGIRYYGLSELTDMAVAVHVPTRAGLLGAGAYRYGFALFSEHNFRLGYANDVQGFRYGAVVSYTHISQGGGYGSFGAMGVDVGLAAEPVDGLWLGARATNVNRPRYGTYGEGIAEEPPREGALGFSYRAEEAFLFATEVVKEVRFPLSWRSGAEVTLVDTFTGRAGVTTRPLTFAMGFGYRAETWVVNLVAQKHSNPILGVSPGLDFSLLW